MKTVQISLNSIDKVKSFVNAITQFNFDFDLISGRYVKSFHQDYVKFFSLLY